MKLWILLTLPLWACFPHLVAPDAGGDAGVDAGTVLACPSTWNEPTASPIGAPSIAGGWTVEAIYEAQGRILIAVTSDAGVSGAFYSDDDGGNWQPSGAGGPAGHAVFLSVASPNAFAIDEHGAWSSSDNGANWRFSGSQNSEQFRGAALLAGFGIVAVGKSATGYGRAWNIDQTGSTSGIAVPSGAAALNAVALRTTSSGAVEAWTVGSGSALLSGIADAGQIALTPVPAVHPPFGELYGVAATRRGIFVAGQVGLWISVDGITFVQTRKSESIPHIAAPSDCDLWIISLNHSAIVAHSGNAGARFGVVALPGALAPAGAMWWSDATHGLAATTDDPPHLLRIAP